MTNPFTEDRGTDTTDEALVVAAVEGDRGALEELILRHQAWIYNIALRMVWNPQDAEDVTQEVLLKIITKLSTFKGDSTFRTWAYRIVANHVINMKKRSAEDKLISFDQYWKSINRTPNMDMPDPNSVPVELPLIVEEVKIHCMMGMLLCLDRRKRLVFVLGEILGVTDRVGSEIMDITRDNFRKILSRSRKLVYGFMREKCGLMDKNNPCHCHRKAQAMMNDGEIDPGKLRFNNNYFHRVKAISKDKYRRLDNILYSEGRKHFKDHPFQTPPDFAKSLRKMLHSEEFQRILSLSS